MSVRRGVLTSSAAQPVTAGIGNPDGGTTIELYLDWCGMCSFLCYHHGQIKELSFEVTSPWATVTPPVSYGCPYVVVLGPQAGATQGGLRLTASVHGFDECHAALTCQIDILYEFSQDAAGVWVLKVIE